MQELISVIVPIYRVEPYLDRCIRSLVDQTYYNLEIILIDDGSPDKCPEICDEWEKKDHRIKVIHKENGGLSDARNAGMQIMTGDYVSYIDSDDWVSGNMYEKMLYKIKEQKADICECQFQKTSGDIKNDIQQQTDNVNVLNKKEALKAVIEEKINPVVWNKIYKREIVEGLFFEKGRCNEDEFFTYKAIDKADKIIQIQDVCYYYFFREDSIINETYNIKRLDGLEARYQRMNYLEKYPEVYGIAKRRLVFNCMYHYQKGIRFLSGAELKILKSKVKEIYQNIPIDKKDIREYTSKEKIWFYISKISFDFVCRIRNKFGYGVE